MLRRRILASAMASVMAIGSIAVVANAEDTAVAEKSVKSKADLEAFVKQFDKFRDDDINDYGSISGDRFIDAIEYAENVLSGDSDAEDYTAAYSMLEAVYKRMKIYKAEDLKALLKDSKSIYDQNNIMNEEIGDQVYSNDSFDAFASAYEEADSVVGSSDTRLITDSYEKLDEAKKNLEPNTIVVKSEFRKALKAYETALQKEFAYECWRVGKIETNWAYWYVEGLNTAYGTLFYHIQSLQTYINEAYKEMDQIKSLNKTTRTDIANAYKACVDATNILNSFKADDTARATKANVKTLLAKYNGRLVHDFNTTGATDLLGKILGLYKDGGVDQWGTPFVVNYKSGDNYSSDMKSVAGGLSDLSLAWYTTSGEVTVQPNAPINGPKNTVSKLISAEMTIKANAPFYLALDGDGYALGAYESKAEAESHTYTTADGKTEKNATAKLISKGVSIDLADYVSLVGKVTYDLQNPNSETDNHRINNVVDGDKGVLDSQIGGKDAWNSIDQAQTAYPSGQLDDGKYFVDGNQNKIPFYYTYTDLEYAFDLAQNYLNKTNGDMGVLWLDSRDALAGKVSGSTAEWTLVYRYLKYALADKYDATYGTHTKAEVEKLIEDSYQLAEDTGDAALFTGSHNNLKVERQYALDWVRSANKDKTYKDNVTSYDYNGSKMLATEVYDALNKKYEQLKKEYNAFKYSFDDVYTFIYDTKAKIDAGTLTGSDDLLKALDDAAYALSVVKPVVDNDNNVVEDNAAFTSDRYFQGFNRVYTNEDDFSSLVLADGSTEVSIATAFKDNKYGKNGSHHDLKVAYEALMDAVKKQTEKVTKLGDVDGDGDVDMLDAKALLDKIVAKEEVDVKVGDFDGNSKVEIADAKAILEAYNKNGNKPL